MIYIPHRRLHFRSTSTSKWSANGATLDSLDAYLKACYKFNTGALTTDSSGNSHTLTNVGSVSEQASGKSGYCAETAGSNYFSFADSDDFNYGSGAFSISFWIYMNSTDKQVSYQQECDAASNFSPVFISIEGQKLLIGSSNNGTTWDKGPTAGSTTLSTATWYHVMVIGDGSDIKGYVNNNLEVTLSSTGTLYNSSRSIKIGAYVKNNGATVETYSNARFDEYMIWKGVALSSDQRTALYNSGTGAFWTP